MSGFYHKHFLKLLDFTPAELNSLLQLAAKLKADKKSGKEGPGYPESFLKEYIKATGDRYKVVK